ncbi:MAG: Uma2 family endonuclease [Isosphaeraceae bacterium]
MTTASTKAAAITVDEYERMIEDGTIGEDDPIELIEGRLVAKMTKKPDHMSSSGRARRAIESVLPPGWHARVEGPVRIPSRDSEPEPDLAVVRGDIDDYEDRHPDPTDVALVVEIAKSSLAEDRKLAETYGGGGIPTYWIVNLVHHQLEVYARPANGTYSSLTIPKKNELVDLIIDGQAVAQIAVADLLPRR